MQRDDASLKKGGAGSMEADMSKLSLSKEVGLTLKLCKHAATPCKNYPNCRPNCNFQHPVCPLGVRCNERFCSYDHPNRTKKCHLCIKQSQGIGDVHVIVTQCDHRRTACSDFPKCPYGIKCSFMHPTCPSSGCNSWSVCVYEHEGQQKMCYICLKAIKASEEKTTSTDKTSASGLETSASVSLKDSVPCKYDVKCWTPQCPYKHPAEWYKKACPWGQRCRRENCIFVHPPPI